MLEFAATTNLTGGLALLQEHRAAVELLRLALIEAGTPYAAPVEAVCALLPGPSPADVAAAKALARRGPPREQVGLDLAPFGLTTRRSTAMTWYDVLLWGVLPYVVIAVLVSGTIWRYRYDRFGWTTRSSQLYESRLLRIGSPLFHFGLLVVIVGHVDRPGHPEELDRRRRALAGGLPRPGARCSAAVAGFCTLVGVGLLIYRAAPPGPVFMRDHPQRQAHVRGARRRDRRGPGHDVARRRGRRGTQLPRSPSRRGSDRSSCSNPTSTAMAGSASRSSCTPLIGMALFALWPFTRLVHAFTAPMRYLFRPYIVYRSREAGTAARRPRPGWEAVGPEASRRR